MQGTRVVEVGAVRGLNTARLSSTAANVSITQQRISTKAEIKSYANRLNGITKSMRENRKKMREII